MKRLPVKFGLGFAMLTLMLGIWGINHPAKAQDAMPAPQGQMQGDPAAMMMKMMNARPADLKKADMTVMKAKAMATKKGMYSCCLKHPCDWCALKMGACPCGKSAAMSMPVCNECKGGWAAGDGAIPGLTADQIKTFPRMDMMPMGKKMGMGAPAAARVIVVHTCPITGGKVVGAGAGMSRVANYEVHFCCAGCKPEFDKLPKTAQLQKIRMVLAKS